MKPGYSKLVIYDMVMPDKGAGRFETQMDITMMALLSGMERSEKHWRTLLASAGLVVRTIWTKKEGGDESVIEAVLAEDA